MPKFEDNEKGAKEFANYMYDIKFFDPTIFEPDQYAKNVWLAIDPKNERASVLYLADNDEEGVLYRGSNPYNYL